MEIFGCIPFLVGLIILLKKNKYLSGQPPILSSMGKVWLQPIQMISTKHMQSLPDAKKLKASCKAMAVLDAIFSQEWIYRYYSFDHNWSENEEFFEMRNGEGGQMLILFRAEGTVINGYSSEANQHHKEKVTHLLPPVYHEFIFGEPVNSSGTTFCLWTDANGNWTTGQLSEEDDFSEELLSALDGVPQTYINWASAYYAGSYVDTGIPLDTVTAIFNHEPLTKEMVLSLVNEIEDWEQLKTDLLEISYQYHIID